MNDEEKEDSKEERFLSEADEVLGVHEIDGRKLLVDDSLAADGRVDR